MYSYAINAGATMAMEITAMPQLRADIAARRAAAGPMAAAAALVAAAGGTVAIMTMAMRVGRRQGEEVGEEALRISQITLGMRTAL